MCFGVCFGVNMGIAELPSVDEEQIERYLKALCAEAEQHGQVRGGGVGSVGMQWAKVEEGYSLMGPQPPTAKHTHTRGKCLQFACFLLFPPPSTSVVTCADCCRTHPRER